MTPSQRAVPEAGHQKLGSCLFPWHSAYQSHQTWQYKEKQVPDLLSPLINHWQQILLTDELLQPLLLWLDHPGCPGDDLLKK